MISALGRSVIDGLGTAGYATRFFFRLLFEFFPLLRRPRLVTKQIHFVGNYSLVIIAVSGLFVGFVLGLQGYYTLNRYGSEQALGCWSRFRWCGSSVRWSPRSCSRAVPARRSRPKSV